MTIKSGEGFRTPQVFALSNTETVVEFGAVSRFGESSVNNSEVTVKWRNDVIMKPLR